MKQVRPYPKAIITRKAARSLSQGHPWVFAGELIRLEPTMNGEFAYNGCIVDVFEENGTWQGAGFLSEQSTIRVRLITRNANDCIDASFWERRLRWAWEYRARVMGGDRFCCRLIFSEADGFPGLVVDRYGDVVVAQIGTVGMELLRDDLFEALLRVLNEAGEQVLYIFERSDAASRTKEGLALRSGWWRGTDGTLKVPENPIIQARENGVLYSLNLAEGQKTGFFLDQKYNRKAVAHLASGLRVMDAFCHVGPFGLNALTQGAEFVHFVDASKTALASVEKNAALNGLDTERFSTSTADIVEWLPALAREKHRLRDIGGPFNLVVLDPPAFAKRRSDVRGATRAYRVINEAALRILPRGGYLATCSCSHFMTRDLLAQTIAEAAHGAGVQLKQLEERQQAPDHPILVGFPESHYLDFFIFQLV